jgi:hypothetical protein
MGDHTSAGINVKPPVPLKVRFSDGTATNIILAAAILDAVAKKSGGDDAARKLARKFAKEAPADTPNRSKWVTEALTKEFGPPL